MALSFKMIFLILLGSAFLSCYGVVVEKRECSADLRKTSLEDCPKHRSHVCAYFSKTDGCDSDICQRLETNECTACSDSSVEYYTVGPCESNTVFCDATTRQYLHETCDEYGEVCAYYTIGCPEGQCGKKMKSSCQACQDPDVIYYKYGKCNKLDEVQSCSSLNTSCNQNNVSVCLYANDCSGDNCAKTFENACEACKENESGSYKYGVCKNDRKSCEDNMKCDVTENEAVCAYFMSFYEAGDYDLRQATVDNACIACQDTALMYYTPGKCPSDPERREFCLPNHLDRECPDEGEPSCGVLASNDTTFVDFPNSCTACKNSSIAYYFPRKCHFLCQVHGISESNITGAYEAVNCNGTHVEPICVYYTEDTNTTDGEVKYKTLSIKNMCVGCYDLYFFTNSYYITGLCPEDEGIRCENEPTSYYYEGISPVCGLLKDDCDDESCRTTFAEPYVACNISSSILYKPGLCPGDQGISCEPYRSQTDFLCKGKDLFTLSVCGYSEKDCQDSSCQQTFTNPCYACLESSTLFFTQGKCSSD